MLQRYITVPDEEMHNNLYFFFFLRQDKLFTGGVVLARSSGSTGEKTQFSAAQLRHLSFTGIP